MAGRVTIFTFIYIFLGVGILTVLMVRWTFFFEYDLLLVLFFLIVFITIYRFIFVVSSLLCQLLDVGIHLTICFIFCFLSLWHELREYIGGAEDFPLAAMSKSDYQEISLLLSFINDLLSQDASQLWIKVMLRYFYLFISFLCSFSIFLSIIRIS